MTLRHALRDRYRDLRWWYRTTVDRWTEAPKYVDCPNCAGRVYHYQHSDRPEVVTYRCRKCAWRQYGTTAFEFYRKREPDDVDPSETPLEHIDVDELVRILTQDGSDAVISRLEDELDRNDIRENVGSNE